MEKERNFFLIWFWQFSKTFSGHMQILFDFSFHDSWQITEKKGRNYFWYLLIKKQLDLHKALFFNDQQQFDEFFPLIWFGYFFLAIFYNFWLLFCRVYTVVSPSPASVSLSTVACISVSTIPWSQFFWEQMHLFFGHSCWDGELPSFPVRISFKSFK